MRSFFRAYTALGRTDFYKPNLSNGLPMWDIRPSTNGGTVSSYRLHARRKRRDSHLNIKIFNLDDHIDYVNSYTNYSIT